MTKSFNIVYINHKASNAFIIPLFIIICIVADWFDFIKNAALNWTVNIIFVLLVVYFYNRFSNIIFKRTGVVNFVDDYISFNLGEKRIIYDSANIKEVCLSYDKQLLRKYIQLTIKPINGKPLNLISERYSLSEDLQDKPLTDVFLYIKRNNPSLSYEEMFDGNFFTLTNEKAS